VTEPLTRLGHHATAILGRTLDQPELGYLSKYLKILSEWNTIHRLVGSSDPQWLVDNIVLDSLLFLRVLPASAARVLDVGSGAGVPGIPLKIVRPEMELVMVESRRKRASFLSAAVRALGLRGATVVNARIEALGSPDLGTFDVVTARCTSSPSRLFATTCRFLADGGRAIVSGPPEKTALGAGCRWVEVRNPMTGLMRNFAVMDSPPTAE
jgi:16S rRNA (guanine527-N7)-methyltransferase